MTNREPTKFQITIQGVDISNLNGGVLPQPIFTPAQKSNHIKFADPLVEFPRDILIPGRSCGSMNINKVVFRDELFEKPVNKYLHVLKKYDEQSAIALCDHVLSREAYMKMISDCPDTQEEFMRVTAHLMEAYRCIIGLSEVAWPVGSTLVLTNCYSTKHSMGEGEDDAV